MGRGASAAVWEATHIVTAQTVALKIFGGEAGLGGDGKRRDRLLREARAASRSRHPHVLAIDDLLDLEDGRAALVMPLLVGESLRDRLSHQGKLPAAEVRALFAPALEGLARAHDAGVIHRDLKPDNLFVTAEPARLVILDFGVAKISADGDLGLTSTGVTVGTPFYMAPEQLFGEDDVDARADVWALGVVLFECLRGERPTEAGNLGQLLKRVSAGKVGRLEEADVPGEPALVAIVNAMLSVERAARPSLAEVRAAFEPSVDAPAPVQAVVVARALPSEPDASTPPSRRLPRRTTLAIAGLLVALGATASIVWGTALPPPVREGPAAASTSAPPVVASVIASAASAPPSSAAPETSATARPAPSSSAASPRGPLALPSPPVSTAAASAKIVAAPPAGTVSSPPPPPRIVEQAPF